MEQIWDSILTELVGRSYELMRKSDPEADRAFVKHSEIAARMEAFMKSGSPESGQLYEEFLRSLMRTNAYEVEHAYLQGMKDCIALMQKLGLL